MSTLNRLPEELLDAILDETLTLPSSSFLEWHDAGTYGCKPTSTSADVLLVCKTWARVGQCHLYEGIILRRKKQAETLAHTLLADKKGVTRAGVPLAERIRRLRIDKVQCKHVKDILRLAVKVQDLHLSLAVPASAGPIDWLAAFRSISPRRLYLQETENTYSNNERLIDAIEDALTSKLGEPACWNKLEELHIKGMDFSIMPGLGTALSVLPHLQLITASDAWCQKWWEAFIPLVTRNEHLQAVLVQFDPCSMIKSFNLQGRPEEITHYGSFDLANLQIPSPISKGLTATSDGRVSADRLPDSVWHLILSYAMVGHAPGDYRAYEGRHGDWLWRKSHFPRSQDVLLVSRRFKSIAEPLLHTAPIFKSEKHAQKYSQLLHSRPELTRHIRVLSSTEQWGCILVLPWIAPNLRVSHNLLMRTTLRGHELGSHRMPRSLVSLDLHCGDFPRGRHGLKSSQQDTRLCLGTDFFDDLHSLKHLSMCGCVMRLPEFPPAADALPRLESLYLSLENGYGAIYCLSMMELVQADNPPCKELIARFTPGLAYPVSER
ncbi:hypothetical protein BD414DRAFT_488058 [Trametes punicea]|nr:hypothetical protein BD414DRAFT_488058 [Trametes punicea]